MQTSGASRRENADAYSDLSAALRGALAISWDRTPVPQIKCGEKAHSE